MIEFTLQIPIGSDYIRGNLNLIYEPKNIIIFASENGINPRNLHIAKIFNNAGFSTFIFDLLFFPKDILNAHMQFDNQLVVQLITVTQWIQQHGATEDLDFAYFGDNAGSAAALVAATQLPCGEVKAIVSCDGRPDLAGHYLEAVCAPTLLIIGQNDNERIKENKHAFDQLSCQKKLTVIKEASHLLENASTLEKAAFLACDWFKEYML